MLRVQIRVCLGKPQSAMGDEAQAAPLEVGPQFEHLGRDLKRPEVALIGYDPPVLVLDLAATFGQLTQDHRDRLQDVQRLEARDHDRLAVVGGNELERAGAHDPRATIRAVAADVQAGVPLGALASRFHRALARATVQACVRAASAEGIDLIVLSGGVFQNKRLLEAVAAGLRASGLRVLTAERLPVGDGGISYGQAAIAARRLAVGGWVGAG